ncbi:MAG: hypothetical protein ABSD75_04610 [Terriglobales bacterium]
MTAHAAGANSFSDGAPEVGPKDWSTAYSQYLVRSAAQSAKTLKLYQEVLEHVSQGKLAPTVFQEHFPRFAQARGVEYARKLSELGAQFLSGLVRVGTFNAAPPERAGAGGFESDIQPPHFEPSDPARWIQQLAEYVGALNARALKAYRRQLDRVAAGEATPGEVQQTTSDYLANHLPLYLQRAGQLYLDLLNGVNEIRAGYEEDYFLTMLAAAPAAGGESAIEPPVVLNLSGPLGGVACASLTVANTTQERTGIRCTATEVRRADGQGPAFEPQIAVTPEGLELDPGQEATLQLSLPLGSDYDADALHVCSLHITGQGDLYVEVKLRITAVTTLAGGERPRSAQ